MYYAHPYLKTPGHAITIDVIGCGGTGSQMLTGLARLHTTLLALGHPGLYVRVFDADTVSEANIGRQHFIYPDLGRNKAIVSVERINRFYGTQWLGIAYRVADRPNLLPNILITCVDSVASRVAIGQCYKPLQSSFNAEGALAVSNTGHDTSRAWSNLKADGPYQASCCIPLYWLDTGNGKDFGQVVLGTWEEIPPGSQYLRQVKLPTVLERFPDMKRHEDSKEQGPSCSLAEALARQDLLINPMVANIALAILDKLVRHGELEMCGAYVNLRTLEMAPMPIPEKKAVKPKRQPTQVARRRKAPVLA